MRPLFWIVAVLLGLAWSGLGWLLWRLAGAGGAAVVAVSRWLELEPSSTQWLADALDMAGWLAQLVVVLVWLIGLLVLVAMLWLVRKVGEAAEAENPRDEVVYGRQVVEGEITARNGAPPRPDAGRSD